MAAQPLVRGCSAHILDGSHHLGQAYPLPQFPARPGAGPTGGSQNPKIDVHPRFCHPRKMNATRSASLGPQQRPLTGNHLKSNFLSGAVCVSFAFLASTAEAQTTSTCGAARKPNIVLILADDLGYADLSCFGSDRIDTPNIDRMAETGMKFTDFYVTAPLCTPTRASIMTGSYPSRVGLGSPLHARAEIGLNPEEVTLPELLKSQGYATALIGKWHLGHHPMFYPTRHGFDFYYGTPLGHCFLTRSGSSFSDLFLRNEEKITFPPIEYLTEDLTREAVQWIKANQTRPFFLFMSHPMPHGPVAASDRFRGQSDGGPYGDAVETIDWSTGELIKAIEELGLSQDSIVVFTSDNGAGRNNWGVEDADWLGSNAPFRG